MIVWLLILLIVVFLLTYKRENFDVSFSGYKQPRDVSIHLNRSGVNEKEFEPDVSGITNDDIKKCVEPVVAYIKKDTGMCVYPVETNKVEKFVNPKSGSVLYKVRFMFTVTSSGFPYTFGIDADVLDGKVVVANTQDMYRAGKELSTDNFLPFSEIENFKIYSR